MKTTWVTGMLLLGVTAAAPAGGLAQPEAGTRVTVVGGAYTNIGPAALRAMLARKDFLLVNVHVPYEGEIAQTDAQVPFDQMAARREALPADRDARIVLYYRTTDGGGTWTRVDDGPGGEVKVLASMSIPTGMGGIWLYAGTAEGLQRSPDCF